jgi:hypothetical protein
VEGPLPRGGIVLVGGGVDGASDVVCAEMSVAKVRKMLMSSRRIENDMLAWVATATTTAIVTSETAVQVSVNTAQVMFKAKESRCKSAETAILHMWYYKGSHNGNLG